MIEEVSPLVEREQQCFPASKRLIFLLISPIFTKKKNLKNPGSCNYQDVRYSVWATLRRRQPGHGSFARPFATGIFHTAHSIGYIITLSRKKKDNVLHLNAF